MKIYTVKFKQIVKANSKEVWEFFSNPANLPLITPAWLNFKILGEMPTQMYAGLVIKYSVTPILGIALQWMTEITHILEGEYFVDDQRVGPYKLWHHQHKFKQVPEGVLVEDEVNYGIGFGPLDSIINQYIVAPKIREIFNYRQATVEARFQ